MMFQNERHMFVSLLKARLSGQLHNVSLLYHGVPELRELLAAFGIYLAEPQVLLSMEELGARFQNLVECVYGTLSDVRMLALVCFAFECKILCVLITNGDSSWMTFILPIRIHLI
jgi:hypothetical protein